MAVPDYYNRVNPDLLQALPPDARTILEIGCGTGVMAREYRRINPLVRYLGVEMNPDAAILAEEHIDRVLTGDVAAVDLGELGVEPGAVDCLVFGDVLEHMLDPWSVLAKLTPLLREGGQAVACIPNVQHWTILVNLLMGRWEYADEGLMDRTHLRFFTVDSMRKLFTEAGLKVFDMRPRIFPSPDLERFVNLVAPVVRSLGQDPNRFALCTSALQFIVRSARLEAGPRKLLVQTLIAEPLVCARVRVVEPDQFLGRIPGVRTIAAMSQQALGGVQPGEAKIFIRQRNVLLEGPSLRSQVDLIRQGYLVIAEFDDDPFHFPEIAKHNFLTFSACHAVQTSTEALAEKIRLYNPHVKVIANQIASLPPPRPARESGPVTLFFGALNREEDWAAIMPALNRVMSDFGNMVRIRVVYDQAFFQALATPFKDFEPFCPYPRYQEILHSSDIALLPLNPTPFNSCKSDLKFIECGASGVVALASPTVYARTLQDGETGVIFNDPEEFESKLRTLIEDHAGRRAIADAAYRYVAENRLLSQHYRERYDWYIELLDNWNALNQEMDARVPEMSRL